MTNFNNQYNQPERREGGASDAEMERRYSQQQAPVDPNDALLMGAMQDPYMKQQLAQELRQRMMGQQQQQAPADPLADKRQALADAQKKAADIRAMPADQIDYGALYQADREVDNARFDLHEAENNLRYQQQINQQNAGQVQQIFAYFVKGKLEALPISPEQRQTLAEEFIMTLRSAWAPDVLGDPNRLQQVLPDQWDAFAYQKGLPRPGTGPQNPPPPARHGEEFNGAQQPTPPAPNPNDPLARLAEMNDMERAMMKAHYAQRGDMETANKITNRDGSPILNRREI